MSRRYLSVNLLENQQAFLKLLDDYEIDIFSIETIPKLLNQKISDLKEILENLEHKGFLSRIEKGKYCRATFRDELVIGSFIAIQGAVAYWTALNRHGLTEQFANTVFIQTTHVKKSKTIFGVPYKFVKISISKQTGIIQEGYGNRVFQMTSLEKTLVDCFDLPQYSGGYAELIRAFAQAELNSHKLIHCCCAVNNIAVIKRMGFLADLLDKSDLKPFIQYASQTVNKKYNLFDSMGEERGEFDSKWRLRLNISREDIQDICNKQY